MVGLVRRDVLAKRAQRRDGATLASLGSRAPRLAVLGIVARDFFVRGFRREKEMSLEFFERQRRARFRRNAWIALLVFTAGLWFGLYIGVHFVGQYFGWWR